MDLATQRLMMGASGAGGDPIYVEDVYAGYKFDAGNATTRYIDCYVDLSTEGGMVWAKQIYEHGSGNWWVYDTERGVNKGLKLNSTQGENTATNRVTQWMTRGFVLGNDNEVSSEEIMTWAFRKCPGFLDIVTYSGDTSANRAISHDLGVAPQFMMIKRTDDSTDWAVWHKDLPNSARGYLRTNSSDGVYDTNVFPSGQTPDANNFYVNANYGSINANGATYVAYLFGAEAKFGPDEDQEIVKVGKYTGGSSFTLNLGWEPAFFLLKRGKDNTDWYLWNDIMGFPGTTGSNMDMSYLRPNDTGGQVRGTTNYLYAKGNGVYFDTTAGDLNGGGSDNEFYYFAIRKSQGLVSRPAPDAPERYYYMGPGQAYDSRDPAFNAGSSFGSASFNCFHPDFAITKRMTADASAGGITHTGNHVWFNCDKTPRRLYFPARTDSAVKHVNMTMNWMGHCITNYNNQWKSDMFRASAGCSSIAWTTGGNHQEDHCLGIAPEMIIFCSEGSVDKYVWHKDLNDGSNSYNYVLGMNTDNPQEQQNSVMTQAPSSTKLYMGNKNSVSGSNPCCAVMFASVNGLIKVGSYTGSGSTVTVDCGFSPRYLLIKAYSGGTGKWSSLSSYRTWGGSSDQVYNWETVYSAFNYDVGSRTSTGFTVNSGEQHYNISGRKYIYLAHA